MRKYPIRLMAREGMLRLGEWIAEKTRILLRGEDYAFLKFYEKHLNSNYFFGEHIEPYWPDVDKKHEELQAAYSIIPNEEKRAVSGVAV